MKIQFLIFLFLFIISGSVEIDSDNQNYNRYLLLDDRIIHSVENVSLQLGSVTKDLNNPLFGEDFWEDPPRPWEARFDNMYPNVIYDKEDGLYKIWYKSFVRDFSSENVPIEERPFNEYIITPGGRQRGILYAYSEGGSVRVAVLNESGQTIAGYTLDDSQEITSNVTDEQVNWNGSNLLNLIGKKVAFKFELDNAKLFSLVGHLEFD
jgi:hypothetical protein